MKHKLIIMISMAILAGSCSLKETIVSSSIPSEYYKNAVQCRTGLNGCYTPLRTIFSNRQYFWATEAQGDLLYTNQADQYDGILQITQSQPQYGATVWTQCYSGIMRANMIMAALQRASFPDAEKNPLIGECTVIRAMYYYLLTCTFGDVPFYECEVTGQVNDSIARLPRTPASVIRKKMTDELYLWLIQKKALPFERTYDDANAASYRMGAAVGLMLGGKMCMWDHRWDEAKEYYGYLEGIYGNGAGNPAGVLAQYPLSDVKFRNKYTKESIWEIAFTCEPYGLRIVHNLASVCTPSHTATASEEDDEDGVDDNDYYGGIAIPEMGNLVHTITATRPTRKLYYGAKALMAYNAGSGDLRACTSNSSGAVEDGGGYLAWGWIGYLPGEDRSRIDPHWNWFSGFSAASKPYLGDKFWCFGMQYTSDSNNPKMFRYAGVLLDLAEANLMSGDAALACLYLNEVKRRAGLPAVDQTVGDEALMNEIMNECGRELLGEFQRKYDLVRWDIWYETVKASRETNAVSGDNFLENLKPCHRYYPVPSEQITYSGGALSNPEYEKYGI